jgi:hypothetical protein
VRQGDYRKDDDLHHRHSGDSRSRLNSGPRKGEQGANIVSIGRA